MSDRRPITVMVVDDHPLMRDGLSTVLGNSGECEVVAVAADGVEAVTLAEALRPDAVIMDVMMPNRDGIDACRDIVDLLPDTKVLMLTASTEDESLIQALAAGATGYVFKDTGLDDLITAIREVVDGQVRIPAGPMRKVFAAIQDQAESASRRSASVLTEREQEVLAMFAAGRSYTEIAGELGNSPSTIRNTIYRIQDKLGVGSKQEIVVWAVRNGLLDDEGEQ